MGWDTVEGCAVFGIAEVMLWGKGYNWVVG
jgi:hypothetical protein